MPYDIPPIRYLNQTPDERDQLLGEEQIDLESYLNDGYKGVYDLVKLIAGEAYAEEIDPKATTLLTQDQLLARDMNDERMKLVREEYNELLPSVKAIIIILASRKFEYINNRSNAQKLLDNMDRNGNAYQTLVDRINKKVENAKINQVALGYHNWLFPKTEILQVYLTGPDLFIEKLRYLVDSGHITNEDCRELEMWFHSVSSTKIAMSMLQVKRYAESFVTIKNTLASKKVDPNKDIYFYNNGFETKPLSYFLSGTNLTSFVIEFIMKPMITEYKCMNRYISELVANAEESGKKLSHFEFHPLAIDPSQQDGKSNNPS